MEVLFCPLSLLYLWLVRTVLILTQGPDTETSCRDNVDVISYNVEDYLLYCLRT